MINGVHHVSLATADLDAFLGFYRDLLGLPLNSEGLIEPAPGFEDLYAAFESVTALPGTRARVAQLGAGNLQIEVFQYLDPLPRPGEARPPCDVGIRHIAFDVTDIEAEYARLKAAGVPSLSVPQTMGPFGLRSVYLRDPDGNIVELQEVLPGSPVDKSHVTGLRAGEEQPA